MSHRHVRTGRLEARGDLQDAPRIGADHEIGLCLEDARDLLSLHRFYNSRIVTVRTLLALMRMLP